MLQMAPLHIYEIWKPLWKRPKKDVTPTHVPLSRLLLFVIIFLT